MTDNNDNMRKMLSMLISSMTHDDARKQRYPCEVRRECRHNWLVCKILGGNSAGEHKVVTCNTTRSVQSTMEQ